MGSIGAITEALTTLMSFYVTLVHYWIRKGTYSNCPAFKNDLHAKTYLYSIALLHTLWNEPHYRHPSFYKDLVTNLRNVAIPGTGVPLSIISSSRIILFPFLLFVYPLLVVIGAFLELGLPSSYQKGSFIERWCRTFSQILVRPQNWFAFWRMNCHIVSLHALKTNSPGYRMENKWDFLIDAEKENIAVTPYMKSPVTLIAKDRNEEGGMGIHIFKNAAHGGNWILQEKLDNSDFLKTLLPENAPLSTFRIITASRHGLPHTKTTQTELVKSLSCVFRAGLAGASTDHKSIMFDVDMKSGEIMKGSTTNHWYRIGSQHLGAKPYSVGHNITHHPDTNHQITGNRIKEIQECRKLCEDAHAKLMKDVPLCGWDVAITEIGVLLLEVNISCNFFRGTFDQGWYFQFVNDYFLHLEKIPMPVHKASKKL